MKTNQVTLKISNFLFAALLAVCILPFAGCGDDDKDDPIVDKLEAGTPVLKNRTETVEAGKAVFSDAVEVPGTLYTKIGDKTETSTVKKETTLKSEATWASPITISALSGDIVKPTLTASASGLTFDFGAFKLDNAVKFTNPTYTLTESGKSAAIAFYGFNGGEATADPVVTSGVEGNKSVTTITQAFKIKHSDGTLTKECTLTAKFEQEITGPPVVVSYTEVKDAFTQSVDSRNVVYSWTVRRKYNYGADSDTTFTYSFNPNLTFTGYSAYTYAYAMADFPEPIFEFDKFVEVASALNSSKDVTDNLKVDEYKYDFGLSLKHKGSSGKDIPYTFYAPKVIKYSEKGKDAIELSVPDVVQKLYRIVYTKESTSRGIFTPTISLSFGVAEILTGRSHDYSLYSE